MKKIHFVLGVAALMTWLAVTAMAQEVKKDTLPAKPIELKNQNMCPVMGDKIDSAYYADIQGQRVYFCCPKCAGIMKKDPDKYFKKAAEEGVLFQNIQTVCPVSGEKINKANYLDYEGRRVYFCCDKCPATFKKDPQKYLSVLDKQTTSAAKKAEKAATKSGEKKQ